MSDAPLPRRRWPRLVTIQLAVLVAAFVLGEIGCRIYLRSSGRPYDADHARGVFQELFSRTRDFVPRAAGAMGAGIASNDDSTAQQRILHPYQGWEVMGSVEQHLAESSRLGAGVRDQDFELLIVGGSVADVFGQYGAARLEERIRADPRFAGREVYSYKYARGGYKHPQIVFSVQYLLSLGYTPECVIAIDGFNDVALSNENASMESNPILPSTMHWRTLAMNGTGDRVSVRQAAAIVENLGDIEWWTSRAVETGAYRSALLGTIAFSRVQDLQKRTRVMTKEYANRLADLGARYVVAGPPFDGRGLPAVQRGVKAWEEGSRTLRALCEARGIRYVHVLQPTLHDPGAKPMTDEEREKGVIGTTWLEGVTLGYPLLREAGARLASGGEDFHDASRIFADDARTLYFDSCHFGVEGNLVLAEFVADALLR